MSSLTILPNNETKRLKDKDVAYRTALLDNSDKIDLNPLSCVSAVLKPLAVAYNMPYWDSDWNEEVKRKLVAEARELHKHAGTPWVLLRILEIMGLSFQNPEQQAIIIEYGNRDNYRYQIKRDGTKKYNGTHKHNGNALIYDFAFGHWSEFGVVIKVQAGRAYLRYAIALLLKFKPTHTKLIGIWYEELPDRRGVQYKYNSEHTHGGNIIRGGI